MRFTSPLFLPLLILISLSIYIAGLGKNFRDASRRRDVFSLVLRSLIILCLVLALAGLEIVQSGERLAVVFLMDVSDSMPQGAVQSEINFIRKALQSIGADDQAAIILFGADALVERPMSGLAELAEITSVPITNQTNLAKAIQLGLALFPSGYAKRMVILSDGAETTGDSLTAAKFAAASEAQIMVVPFVNQLTSEAFITDVDVPSHLRSGEKFDLNVTIQASQPNTATVRVLAKNEILYEAAHQLRKGSQTLSLPLTATETGFVSYQVQIAPESDVYYQNNRLDAFSQVQGPPRVLIVAPPAGEELPGGEIRPDEASLLAGAIAAANFQIQTVTPSLLPADLPSLAQFQSIVLVNVPARDLNQNQMEAVRSYVRDLGGGLVAVGGPTSYGVGGYFGTPLEDALPVEMQIKDPQRRPQLTMVFIIDHSGSMGETSGGVMKMELAKEAAARSVEMLFPNDKVGVIAFDDTASWVVPITMLENPEDVTARIAGIQLGGGTDIYAGLLAMSKVLPEDDSKVKHVILLTDGGADPTNIPELVKKLYEENGITLSTVGVGNDAADFLDDLAALGGGRYHFTNNAGSIPSIFTEETSLAARAYIVEESFFPTLTNSSPILSNINAVPQLHGYIASSAKDLARVILKSPKDDPILAQWQYGLGRAVAFTSDATGRWARDWARSEIFAPFWAQAVRYTITDSVNTSLQMTVESKGETANILLDAKDISGNFLNGYEIEGNIVAPNGETQTVTFKQTAPGRYEAGFIPTEQGVYLIRFSGKDSSRDDSAPIAETTGWVLSYSPEYQRVEPNPDLLLRVAEIANGQVASPNPADVFKHNLQSARASQPAAPFLILLAALLLPLDIAARRLVITKYDVEKAKEKVIGKWLIKKPQPAVVESAPQMQALMQAKRRAKDSIAEPVEVKEMPAIQQTESPEEKSAPPQVESTTSALLARKKSRRK